MTRTTTTTSHFIIQFDHTPSELGSQMICDAILLLSWLVNSPTGRRKEKKRTKWGKSRGNGCGRRPFMRRIEYEMPTASSMCPNHIVEKKTSSSMTIQSYSLSPSKNCRIQSNHGIRRMTNISSFISTKNKGVNELLTSICWDCSPNQIGDFLLSRSSGTKSLKISNFISWFLWVCRVYFLNRPVLDRLLLGGQRFFYVESFFRPRVDVVDAVEDPFFSNVVADPSHTFYQRSRRERGVVDNPQTDDQWWQTK